MDLKETKSQKTIPNFSIYCFGLQNHEFFCKKNSKILKKLLSFTSKLKNLQVCGLPDTFHDKRTLKEMLEVLLNNENELKRQKNFEKMEQERKEEQKKLEMIRKNSKKQRGNFQFQRIFFDDLMVEEEKERIQSLQKKVFFLKNSNNILNLVEKKPKNRYFS